MNWKIWTSVPVLYAVFSLWYFNWQGPLTQAEIERFFAAFEPQTGSEQTSLETLRRFFEEDDGRGFVMLNQVQIHERPVPHPVTGELVDGRALLTEYLAPFTVDLLRRGGHPVFQARTVGGHVDSWNADDNVSFSATAMMRYRSRRDLMELAADPAFTDAHIYKLAAIERTVSYPTQVVFNTSLAPPAAVLMLLLLLTSVAQNVVNLRRSTTPPPNKDLP